MKLIDAHRHYSYDESDMTDLPETLDEAGIERTVLFGFHGYGKRGQDKTVMDAARRQPDRIIPFACDLNLSRPDAPECARRRLAEEGFRGLGEFLLGSWTQARYFAGIPIDGEIPMKVFRVAGEYGAPVLIRCDRFKQEEMMHMLRECPDTQFIWAHAACDYAKKTKTPLVEPEYLRYMLIKFKNLTFDFSMPTKLLPGLLTYPYTEVFRDYPDKFCFGTDLTGLYRDAQRLIMPAYLDFYEKLPDEVRDNFASGNILRLLHEA